MRGEKCGLEGNDVGCVLALQSAANTTSYDVEAVVTVSCAELDTLRIAAVIVNGPSATAVTTPVDETVATA